MARTQESMQVLDLESSRNYTWSQRKERIYI